MTTTRQQLAAAPLGARVNYLSGISVYYIKAGRDDWERHIIDSFVVSSDICSASYDLVSPGHLGDAAEPELSELDQFKAHILSCVAEAREANEWCDVADIYLARLGLGPKFDVDALKSQFSRVLDSVSDAEGALAGIDNLRQEVMSWGEPVVVEKPKPEFEVGTEIVGHNLSRSWDALPVGTFATHGNSVYILSARGRDGFPSESSALVWRNPSGLTAWISGMKITYIPPETEEKS